MFNRSGRGPVQPFVEEAKPEILITATPAIDATIPARSSLCIRAIERISQNNSFKSFVRAYYSCAANSMVAKQA